MIHTVHHELSVPESRRALEAACAAYAERYRRYAPALSWDGEGRARCTFTAAGRSLEGRITLSPGALVFELEVPLALRPFQGRARRVVENEVQRWAAKVRAGEI